MSDVSMYLVCNCFQTTNSKKPRKLIKQTSRSLPYLHLLAVSKSLMTDTHYMPPMRPKTAAKRDKIRARKRLPTDTHVSVGKRIGMDGRW